MVELGVAGIPAKRGLRGRQRVVQLVPRGEASRHAVQGTPVVALDRQRLVKFLFRILEEPDRPERVAVVRERFGVVRRAPRQQLAVRVRVGEIAKPQCRLDAPGQRLALDAWILMALHLLEGRECLGVPAVGKQQLPELQLDIPSFGRGEPRRWERWR